MNKVFRGTMVLLAALVALLDFPAGGVPCRAGDPVPEPPSNPRRPGDVRPLAGLPPELAGLSIQQNLGAQVPTDLVFNDESGQEVKLGRYFGDKPVILMLAYYLCPNLCNEALNKLVEQLRQVKFTAGQDFQVVIVSFDAREKPDLAAAKKRSYVEAYNRPGAEEGWHFLTGEQPAIDQLAQTVGFRFRYDPERDRFTHATALMLLTPEGKVARYLMGLNYASKTLQLSLVEASENKIGSPVDQLVLLCLQYDGVTGKYTARVLNLVRAAGVLTVLLLGGLILRAVRRRPLVGAASRAAPAAPVRLGSPDLP